MGRRLFGCVGIAILVIVVGGLLIQLIPYGHNHTNPPVVSEPKWDSPQTRALAERACFDCHSNQTAWLWYSNVAPVSWLIQNDVDEGRQRLNFSDWNPGRIREPGEISETVLSGKMPPLTYLPLHPISNLSQAEKQQLADGLQATLQQGGG